ncbi:MAG: hypothetical protein KDK62_02860 [Chlamydiia bacterium]|nr:hypothetical protein [Chlamydiia bacterium]
MSLSSTTSNRLAEDFLYRFRNNDTYFLATPDGSLRDGYAWEVCGNQTQRVEAIANLVIHHLSQVHRNGSPKLMQGEQWVHVARLVRKHLMPLLPTSNETRIRLFEEEFSARLGLTRAQATEPYACNILEWASQCRADAAMAYFDHKVNVLADGQIQILTGVHEPIVWHEIRDTCFKNLSRAKKESKEPIRFSLYEKAGPTFRDVFQVTGNHVLKTLSPPPGRNTYSILVHAPRPGVDHNHSWWHYTQETGEIHSYTVYRSPGIARPYMDRGRLAEGPLDDVWPDYSIDARLDVVITDKQLDEMLRFEKWLSTQTFTFHNYDENCTNAALIRLRMLGRVTPQCDVSFWRVFAPKQVIQACLWIDNLLPGPLQQAAEYVAAVVGNCISYGFGASRIDPGLKGQPNALNKGKPIQPHLKSFWDIFDPQKLRFTSPYFFIKMVIEPLQEWRRNEKARLAATPGVSQEAIDAVDYDVPPSWKVAAMPIPGSVMAARL